jgi:peptidoglycan LD-endopeptidase CwlK
MSFQFGNTSKQRLSTCEDYLQKVLNKAISLSKIDFGVAQGQRTVDEQRQYFKEKKSKVNPDAYTKEQLPLKAFHIVDEVYNKSGAVDIFAYVNNKATWDEKHLCYIAGIIMTVDAQMENKLVWGGNWDGDGEIIYDQSFVDLPHFQVKVRTKC